jgi:hypothetical protein
MAPAPHPELEDRVNGDGHGRDEDVDAVLLDLQPVVVQEQLHNRLPPVLRVVPQEDVGQQDDDERLARVTDVGEDALPRQLHEGHPLRVQNQYQEPHHARYEVGDDVGEGGPVLGPDLLAQLQPKGRRGSRLKIEV